MHALRAFGNLLVGNVVRAVHPVDYPLAGQQRMVEIVKGKAQVIGIKAVVRFFDDFRRGLRHIIIAAVLPILPLISGKVACLREIAVVCIVTLGLDEFKRFSVNIHFFVFFIFAGGILVDIIIRGVHSRIELCVYIGALAVFTRVVVLHFPRTAGRVIPRFRGGRVLLDSVVPRLHHLRIGQFPVIEYNGLTRRRIAVSVISDIIISRISAVVGQLFAVVAVNRHDIRNLFIFNQKLYNGFGNLKLNVALLPAGITVFITHRIALGPHGISRAAQHVGHQILRKL